MRYLITGGAGFIGSHLADALLARGDYGRRPRRHLHRVASTTFGTCSSHPSFPLREGTILDHPLVAQARGRGGRRRAPGRRGRGPADRRAAARVAHHQHPGHRDRARRRRRRRVQGAGRLDLGDLRQERDRARCTRTPTGSSARRSSRAVVVQHGQGRRRDPRARATGASGARRAIVVRLFNCVGPRQTGDVRHGRADASSARRSPGEDDHGLRRRRAAPVLLPRADTVDGARCALLDHPGRRRGTSSTSARRTRSSINELAELIIEMTGSRSTVVHIPYEEAYEEGFEDMERRVPDTTKIEALTGWAADAIARGDPRRRDRRTSARRRRGADEPGRDVSTALRYALAFVVPLVGDARR